ncbi:unnamed protein product [Vitrella brassicaformis CCMP3155]|uniref:EF-hand domain-containing protein n=1 Tax=Vitrella brassicaformis (strain CCMP3155) TaxID=1169540 RepID=A0A0G4GX76_VITBC|nr:unnamed protein product [Vitrella brassicaformis CCMP3155]|eukprot:CEM35658.1 unnamed protein product [Vitrella brassicaformis CCMP3155]
MPKVVPPKFEHPGLTGPLPYDPSPSSRGQMVGSPRVGPLENVELVEALNTWRNKIDNKYHNIREAFKHLKGKYDGYMTYEDFSHAVSLVLGELSRPSLIRDLFELFDQDKDGVVSWPEFQDMTATTGCGLIDRFRPRWITPPKDGGFLDIETATILLWSKIHERFMSIQSAYLGFNDNLDAKIDEQEFHAFLQKCGIFMRPEDEEKLFANLDYNNDGKISVREFYDSFKKEAHPKGIAM